MSDTKPLGCSLTMLLARNPDRVAGLRAGDLRGRVVLIPEG